MYGARTGKARVVPVYSVHDGPVGGRGKLVWSAGEDVGGRSFLVRLRSGGRHFGGRRCRNREEGRPSTGRASASFTRRRHLSTATCKADGRTVESVRNRRGGGRARSIAHRRLSGRAARAADRETQLPPVALGERDGIICVAAGDQKLQQLSGAHAARDGTQLQTYLRRLIREDGERLRRKRCMRDYSMSSESMRWRVG